MIKCGYVGVFGKPNAGKSTLVNLLVGEQVAIVSQKPQTTRDNILGIVNGNGYQLVLVDTPGVHHSKNHLDKAMMKNVRSALAGVDVLLYLIDGHCSIEQEEIEYLQYLKSYDVPLVVVKTKKDKTQKNQLETDFYISSFTGEGIDQLKDKLVSLLPQREDFLFPQEYYTDKSVRFLIAEKIRETALLILQNEIPHGICVEIEKFEDKGNLTIIEANVICEQERHKSIIIGKSGSVIKQLGENARKYAEDLLGNKVLLKLFVKVDTNWRERPDKVAKYRVE